MSPENPIKDRIAVRRPLYLIDSHCHLEMEEFASDLTEVIGRGREAGIEAAITVGSSFEGSVRAIDIAEQYPDIYAAVGLHPHDAKDYTQTSYSILKKLSENRKVRAIGETGLDYHYDHSPRDIQQSVFSQHLRLSMETGRPVIIHSREADADTIRIVMESGNRHGVFHCFSGNESMAEEVLSLGFYISIAGTVTFKKAEMLRNVVSLIPDDRLLVETDAPYLTPEPFRGKRNEPAYLLNTVKVIADIRGITVEDAARITTLNAKRLFSIGDIPARGQIAYRIRDSLYLNITNRCSNRCSFCIRFQSDFVKGHNLRLDREPSEEELIREIGDPRQYKEIVFCGYGEPLERLGVVKKVAGWVTENGGSVRINTNGHGNIINGRNVLPELKNIVHSVSVSLDAHDTDTYDKICRPNFPGAFEEVIKFIREAKKVVPEVQVTVVNLPEVDLSACRRIADDLGTSLRIRELDVVG